MMMKKLQLIIFIACSLGGSFANVCEDGWSYFCDTKDCYCYYFNNVDNVTWPLAHSLCKDKSSSLVSIHSKEENYFVAFTAASLGLSQFWTGLNDLVKEGSLRWSDDSPVDFTENVYKGNNYEDCHMVFSTPCNQDQWYCVINYAIPCWMHRTFVCKKPARQRVVCPGAHYYFCNLSKCFCYYFSRLELPGYENPKTWDEAHVLCASKGGYLVSIHSDEELASVRGLIAKHAGSQVWTGLRDRDMDGQFTWTDGSPTDYFNWGAEEPSTVTDTRNCVMLKYDTTIRGYKSYVSECSSTADYVCKREKSIG